MKDIDISQMDLYLFFSSSQLCSILLFTVAFKIVIYLSLSLHVQQNLAVFVLFLFDTLKENTPMCTQSNIVMIVF